MINPDDNQEQPKLKAKAEQVRRGDNPQPMAQKAIAESNKPQTPSIPPGLQSPQQDTPVIQNIPTKESSKPTLDFDSGDVTTSLIGEKIEQSFEKPTKDVDKTRYMIKYTPLISERVERIPKVLHYKPLNGFTSSVIADLTPDNLDEGLNNVLDTLCYESITENFSHWTLPNPDKIRSFINLRLNSIGPFIEHMIGLCESCGQDKIFTQLNINHFDDKDLSEKYQEPFKLKVPLEGEDIKFEARLLSSGDRYKAQAIYEQDKEFITTVFPNVTNEQEETVLQVMEYANSILSWSGENKTFEEKVIICRDNLKVMNALTSFNDYFDYGLLMKTISQCPNKECPTNVRDSNPGDEQSTSRGSVFRFPIQPAIFNLTYVEKGTAEQYFDIE